MGLAHGIAPITIIGAGPAGIACAWRLAQLGFSPLLIEKESFPRDKVCGDALSGKVVALLRKLGGSPLLDDLLQQPFTHPVEHLDFISGKGRRVRLTFPVQQGYPQGFVIPRKDFDAWLLRHLPPSVVVRTRTFIRKVERQTDYWILHTDAGEKIRSRFVVGADGTASRVAPLIWTYHKVPRPTVFPAVRGYLTGTPPEGLELHFRAPYLPGYLWRFPLAGSQLNVGVGLPSQSLKRNALSLRQHLLELFPPIHSVQGHGIPVSLDWRPLTIPGAALIGDAAALADPFTGEGIGNALLSGIRLAEALSSLPLSTWGEADLDALYTRPLYRTLRQEFYLARLLHRLARSPARVEALLGILSRFPSWTKPLLHWYGAR